jgi:Peptidase family M28
MLNWRLYRVAFVPFVFALAVAAFSLGRRPLPVTSTLAPDAFEGARAFTELQRLQARFPDRRPGSAADSRLAVQIASTLKQFGGAHGGGFSVRVDHFDAQTIDGKRRLSTVIAERPGSTSETPLLIVAHRDAALRGSEAELSGTAALLELARVFAARETKRTIVLASTSGGSGGDAGAARLASQLHGPFDAAIVLGDLAGAGMRAPAVVPFSDGQGSAPLQLQRTVADAIEHEAGIDPGAPSTLGQLVHLALPLALGEQGALNADGLPAVLVQVSGERGPAAHAPVSAARLEGFGRAVLSALDALDAAPDISRAKQTGVLLQRQTMPAWALRLLAITLLFPPLITVADGFARLRRRRMPVRRWLVWTLTCALPFFSCAVLAYLLGWLGILGAAPAIPAPPRAMPLNGQATTAIVAVALTFALAWLLWTALVRRLEWGARPDPEVAGLSAMIVLVSVGVIVWFVNPLAALLLVPALHLWLVLAAPELRPRRIPALALLLAPVLPLALLIAFYGHQLGMGPGSLAWTAVQMLAGGHIGIPGALIWSLALGGGAAVTLLVVRSPPLPGRPRGADGVEVTIRGPMSYAGPGSLGGTESALRR